MAIFKLLLKLLLVFFLLGISIYYLPKYYFKYECESIFNEKNITENKLIKLKFFQYSVNDYYLYHYSFNGLYSCHALINNNKTISIKYYSKFLY